MSESTLPLRRSGTGPAPSQRKVQEAMDRVDPIVRRLRAADEADTKRDTRKTCSTCKKRKALSQFAKDSRKPNGVRSQCRACVQQRRRELRAEKKSKPKVNPAEQEIRTASRRAVEQLIHNHRAEFERLIRTERALLNGGKQTWTNLTNEFAMSD